MCIICIDCQKGKLKLDEAWKNFNEMNSILDDTHLQEVFDMLWKNTAKITNNKNEK